MTGFDTRKEDCDCPTLQPRFIREIEKLKHLEEISILFITSSDFPHFWSNTIRNLKISNYNDETIYQFIKILGLSSLKHLTIYRSTLNDEAIKTIASLELDFLKFSTQFGPEITLKFFGTYYTRNKNNISLRALQKLINENFKFIPYNINLTFQSTFNIAISRDRRESNLISERIVDFMLSFFSLREHCNQAAIERYFSPALLNYSHKLYEGKTLDVNVFGGSSCGWTIGIL